MKKSVLIIVILLLACSENEHIATNSSQENSSISSSEKNQAISPAADINTPVTSLPEEIDNYARELVNMQNTPNAGAGVYGLWKLGQMASKSLIQSPFGGDVNILERLNKGQLKDVINKMKGYFVNREEVIFAEPDPVFFLALAKRANDQSSIDFFENLNKTKPGGIWPVYVQQQTDFSGCIRFGSMSLLETYTLWDAYMNKYPSRYADEVHSILGDVRSDLSTGTCACDSAKLAIDEFEAFIQAHPNAEITSRLRERVNQYKQGKSDLREHCISG